MQTSIRILFIILCSSMVLTACKKDKDKNSKMGLLTDNPWVMTKFEERENTGQWDDTFDQFEPCSKDDRWVFKTNMSIQLTEGTVACTGNTPNEVLEETTWAFAENESKLKIEDELYVIEELNSSTLIISISETIAGTTYSTRVTLAHP